MLVPPFSEMLASPAVTVNVGVSSSVMLMVSLPSTKPVAAAEMVTVWSPSARASSWAVTVKVTEASPAGISTVTGTVASLVSSLVRFTVRAALLSTVLRDTVKVLVPPFSVTLVSPAVTVRAASIRLIVPVRGTTPSSPPSAMETEMAWFAGVAVPVVNWTEASAALMVVASPVTVKIPAPASKLPPPMEARLPVVAASTYPSIARVAVIVSRLVPMAGLGAKMSDTFHIRA